MAQHIFRPGSGDDYYWNELGERSIFVFGNISGNAQGGAVRFVSCSIPQGTTISSAQLKVYKESSAVSGSTYYKIRGIDEDNTADFSGGDPNGRSPTTAEYTGTKDANMTNQYAGFDVKDIVQEIVNRGGWSSGNAIGLFLNDNGTTTTNARFTDLYDGNNSIDTYLEVAWDEPSPSASVSPSSSVSKSPSPSPSASPSLSASPSPSAYEHFRGIMRVAKPGYNVLTDDDPRHMIFSSEYGTLKYFTVQDLTISLDGTDLTQTGSASHTHNLGYYPYFEVYVQNPLGDWEYCPTKNGGVSTNWSIYAVATTTKINVYVLAEGFTEANAYNFKVFVYKNNLNLT